MEKWTGRNDQWIFNKHYIKCNHSNKVHEGEVVYMRVYNGKSIMNLRKIDWTHVEGTGNYSVFSPWKLQIDLESEMFKKTYNGDSENIKLYISTLFGLTVDFNDTYVTSNQFGNKKIRC